MKDILLTMKVKILLILVELGFVIKKESKSIKKENFKDYIECYFVCLDLTDRTFQASNFMV